MKTNHDNVIKLLHHVKIVVFKIEKSKGDWLLCYNVIKLSENVNYTYDLFAVFLKFSYGVFHTFLRKCVLIWRNVGQFFYPKL